MKTHWLSSVSSHIFVAFLVAISTVQKIAAATQFYVGVADRDITPCTPTLRSANPALCYPTDGTIWMNADLYTTGGGAALIYNIDKPNGNLKARVLMIQDSAGTKVTFITLDLIGIPSEFADVIRTDLSSLQLVTDNILINCSHTHNGPTMFPFNTAYLTTEQPPNGDYKTGLKAQIHSAVADALAQVNAHQKPASLWFGSGTSAISEYRRHDGYHLPYDGPHRTGNACCNDDTVHDGAPRRLDVLMAKDPSGIPIALAFFFGCHPTAKFFSYGVVSSDYPGAAIAEIANRTPAIFGRSVPALFVQGFAGDRQPRSLWGQGSLDDKDHLGGELATDVLNIVQLQTETSVAKKMHEITGTWSVRLRPNNLPRTGSPNVIKNQTQVFRLVSSAGSDSWVLAANSHEVVSEYETKFREEWGDPTTTSLAGYSGFVGGYLPSARMLAPRLAACSQSLVSCGLLNDCVDSEYEGCRSFDVYSSTPKGGWTDPEVYASLGETFSDYFTTGTQVTDPEKWFKGVLTIWQGTPLLDSSVPVSEGTGALKIDPLPNVGGYHYNGYVSQKSYDFTGRQMTVEMVQAPNQLSAAEVLFSVGNGGTTQNLYRYEIYQQALRADFIQGGAFNSAALGTYNPTDHRHLRIRHDATENRVHWEASADRVEWTNLYDRPLDFPIDNVQVDLFAGTFTPNSSPGSAIFDNVEIAKSLWRIGVLSTYAGSGLWDSSVPVKRRERGIKIAPLQNISSVHYNGAVSNRRYNFVGKQASVRLTQIPDVSSTAEMLFSIGANGTDLYRFEIHLGYLRVDKLRSNQQPSLTFKAIYSTTNHKYLRFRHDARENKIYWETSAENQDGTPQNWAFLDSVDLNNPNENYKIDLTSIQFEMIAGTYESVSHSIGTPTFDNFTFADP